VTSVAMSTHLPVPASQVWQLIGGFNALPDWHPMIQKSELEGGGTQRRLTLPDGSTVVEQLEHTNAEERIYTYSILKGPLPVSNYKATIRVVEDKDGKGCSVEWSSEFEASGAAPGDAMAAIQGVYEAGLKNLEKMFGR